MNHFAHMCRKAKALGTANNSLTETLASTGAMFHALEEAVETGGYQLCAITHNNETGRSIRLDHHLYNHLEERWTRQTSKPQPFITLTIRICTEDYTHFGFQPPRPTKSIETPTMADTGCQCCLAGMLVIRRLGLSENDLIPVTTQMHAANNNKIRILGAVLIEFSGTSPNGQQLFTRQITYVTDSSDKLFLSREGCAKLGMISDSFPTIGDVHGQQSDNSIAIITKPEQVDPPTQGLSHPETITASSDDLNTLGLTERDTCSPCRPRKLSPSKPI